MQLRPQSVKHVVAEQKHAIKFTDFLSQIGGFLGLLVEASIVTLFEFFEFFALAFYQKIKLITQRQKSVSVQRVK